MASSIVTLFYGSAGPEEIFTLLPVFFTIATVVFFCALIPTLWVRHARRKSPTLKNHHPWAKDLVSRWQHRRPSAPNPSPLAQSKKNDGIAPSRTASSPQKIELPAELDVLRERTLTQQQELNDLRSEKLSLMQQIKELRNQLTEITAEFEHTYQEQQGMHFGNSASAMAAYGTTKPFEEVDEAETKKAGATTEAEKILIVQQAAEIKRLKDIIGEFRTQVREMQQHTSSNSKQSVP